GIRDFHVTGVQTCALPILTANTIDAYQIDLQRYLLFVGDTRGVGNLSGIAVHHIESYLEELAALGLGTSSVVRALSSIRGFHQFAMAGGLAEANPAAVIDIPKKLKSLPDVLDTDEIMRMIATHNASTPVGKRSIAILELLYATGMRVGELCSLTTYRLIFEI